MFRPHAVLGAKLQCCLSLLAAACPQLLLANNVQVKSESTLAIGNALFVVVDVDRIGIEFDPTGNAVLDIVLTESAAERLGAETAISRGSEIELKLDSKVFNRALLMEPIIDGNLRIANHYTFIKVKTIAIDIACTLGIPRKVMPALTRKEQRYRVAHPARR